MSRNFKKRAKIQFLRAFFVISLKNVGTNRILGCNYIFNYLRHYFALPNIYLETLRRLV